MSYKRTLPQPYVVTENYNAGCINDRSGTPVVVNFAAITRSVSGTATAITAVSGKKLRVLGMAVQAAAAARLDVIESSSGDNVFPNLNVTSSGPLVLPVSIYGWGETSAGEGLSLSMSNAVNVTAIFTYAAIDG